MATGPGGWRENPSNNVPVVIAVTGPGGWGENPSNNVPVAVCTARLTPSAKVFPETPLPRLTLRNCNTKTLYSPMCRVVIPRDEVRLKLLPAFRYPALATVLLNNATRASATDSGSKPCAPSKYREENVKRGLSR